MTAGEEADPNRVRVLLASDLHLGYLERDPVRGRDSLRTFEEILQIAQARDVDFLLLGGDLFHENKPSRATLHETMALLREYTRGDRPVSVELLSDPFQGARSEHAPPTINYEDENINVSMPVFSIHGNHDDPQGLGPSGALSALDVLSAAGLLNYFGRIDLPSDEAEARGKRRADTQASSGLRLQPVLLRKGHTKLALYGMGNVKDERLQYELRAGHIRMYRPAEDPEDWFNILVMHQNRPSGHIPESVFDDSINLVIWGHEHEQRILPEPVAEKNYHISQPGSSIATSLMPGEAVEKCVAVLHVHKKDFMVEPVALQTVRPFVMKDVWLADELARSSLDPYDRAAVSKLLRQHMNSLIAAADAQWDDKMTSVPEVERPERMLPIVRLRVFYDTQIPIGNVARFGNEFAGRIANPRDALQLNLRRGRTARSGASSSEFVRLNKDMMPAEKLERVSLESLVVENLRVQKLDMLNASNLQRSVMAYIEKDDREAVENFVARSTRSIEDTLSAEQLDESRIQAQLEQISAQQQSEGAAHLEAPENRAPDPASAPRRSPSQDSMLQDEPDAAPSPSPEPEPAPAPAPQEKRRRTRQTERRPPAPAPEPAEPAPSQGRAAVLDMLGGGGGRRRRT